jgi:hypothetical protein
MTMTRLTMPWMLLLHVAPAALLISSRAHAQQVAVIRGLVVDSVAGQPVVTGAVHLLGADGQILRTAVSNEAGRFVVPVPTAGTYRLRTERIGYRDQVAGPFTVAVGDTLDLEIRMATLPVAVDTLLARAEREGRPLRPGEQFIYGRLIDDDTGRPIPQGTVRLLTSRGSTAVSVISDADGVFHLVSPGAGTYRLMAERIGYQATESSELHLMLGDSIGVDFRLSTQAVLLNPLTVTASARPWWDRADTRAVRDFLQRYDAYSRNGYGEFMTRDSIAKWERKVFNIGEMLLMNMFAVREVNLDGSVKLRKIGQGDCSNLGGLHYFLNGIVVPYSVVEVLAPSDLEGVEVYTAPNIPGQLGSRVAGETSYPCGVVAYWTRVSPDEHPPRRTIWTYLGVGAAIGVAIFLAR